MFSKGGTRENEKVVAVADIESGSAAVAIVALKHDAPAEILVSERRALSLEERTPRAAVSSVLALLSEAAEKAAAAYAATGSKTPVSSSCAIIHAPLSRSISARTARTLKGEERITEEMIAELARKALSGISDLEKEEVFESGVVRVELNGYPTSSPAGKTAQEIALVVLASACNRSMRSSIESAFGTLFPNAPLTLRSGVRVASSVVGSTLGDSEECLLVDMASDATTFTRLDREMSLEHSLLPDGYATMLRKIAGSGLPEDTLSVMRMMEREDSSEPSSEKVLTALAQYEPELLRACGEAMGELAARRRLPDDLVLLAPQDFTPWLSQFFSRIDFTQFTLTTRPFTVRVLAAETLSHEVRSAAGKADTGLVVAAALVNNEILS